MLGICIKEHCVAFKTGCEIQHSFYGGLGCQLEYNAITIEAREKYGEMGGKEMVQPVGYVSGLNCLDHFVMTCVVVHEVVYTWRWLKTRRGIIRNRNNRSIKFFTVHQFATAKFVLH